MVKNDVPHAVQAIQIRHRRRRLDQPTLVTLRPYTPSPTSASIRRNRHKWPAGSVATGRSRTRSSGSATSPTTRTAARSEVMAALCNAAIGALRTAGVTIIAVANRHHARDSTRPLALLGIRLTTLPGH